MKQKNWRRFLGSMLGGAGCAAVIAAPSFAAEQTAVGTLKIVPTESGYQITAAVDGRATATIDAELTVLKNDKSGRLQTRQSRQVKTKRGEHREIATSDVSMGDNGTLEVKFVLSDGERTVYRISQRVTREIPD